MFGKTWRTLATVNLLASRYKLVIIITKQGKLINVEYNVYVKMLPK